jgi:glutamine amidotransferase
MLVAIIDYGMGNVASVQKALSFLSIPHILTKDMDQIARATHIILPGVGAFKQGMDNIKALGLHDCLDHEVRIKEKPFLGICLGMQLIATKGTEPEICDGLAWVEGEVTLIEHTSGLRIPHLGWNDIQVKDESFKAFDKKDFYFIHSYHFDVANEEDIVATVNYGNPYVAVVRKKNIMAAQFHPEKSQKNGLFFLEHFFKTC